MLFEEALAKAREGYHIKRTYGYHTYYYCIESDQLIGYHFRFGNILFFTKDDFITYREIMKTDWEVVPKENTIDIRSNYELHKSIQSSE